MNDTITLPRSVVEQALSDLSSCSSVTHWPALVASIDALREALKQQVEQEPVAEVHLILPQHNDAKQTPTKTVHLVRDVPAGTKLYTHPQPPRQPPTIKKIQELVTEVCNTLYPQDGSFCSEADRVLYAFVRAIERAPRHRQEGEEA